MSTVSILQDAASAPVVSRIETIEYPGYTLWGCDSSPVKISGRTLVRAFFAGLDEEKFYVTFKWEDLISPERFHLLIANELLDMAWESAEATVEALELLDDTAWAEAQPFDDTTEAQIKAVELRQEARWTQAWLPADPSKDQIKAVELLEEAAWKLLAEATRESRMKAAGPIAAAIEKCRPPENDPWVRFNAVVANRFWIPPATLGDKQFDAFMELRHNLKKDEPWLEAFMKTNDLWLKALDKLRQRVVQESACVISVEARDIVDEMGLNGPESQEFLEELITEGGKFRNDNNVKRLLEGKNSTANLLNLGQDFEYFRTGAMSKPYIQLLNKNHHEVHSLESAKGVVRLRYLAETLGQGQPKRDDLTAMMDVFGARCSAGESREIHVRVAQTPDAIYIDLGDPTWRAIEIKATGWRIVYDPPVLFRRGAGALPLPAPVSGGDLVKLGEIVNVSPDQLVLAAAWLLGRLNPIPGAAMPHLVLQGGPGSTKTTGASILIRMLDPSLAPLTSMPKNEEDAMIAAQDCGVFGLDNISGFRYSMSDLLCCLSTGASRKVRTLYETSGLTVEAVRRPVLINGIDAGFLRGDLADRSTVLSLPKVTGRRTDGEIESAFVAMHPQLLGAICDAAVTGLRKLPTTVLQNPPRMAAYCTWVSACEESLPWEKGKFLKLYRKYHTETNRTLLENDQVGSAIAEWAKRNLKHPGEIAEWAKRNPKPADEDYAEWTKRNLKHLTGDAEKTVSDWYTELTRLVTPETLPGRARILPRDWPSAPNKLAAHLPRIADLLAARG
jgi:hypothetical protein